MQKLYQKDLLACGFTSGPQLLSNYRSLYSNFVYAQIPSWKRKLK